MSEKQLFQEIPKRGDFHSAVLTTFSFDFYHFEAQVLKVLKSKGVTNVCVLADTNMVDQNIEMSIGNIKTLSKAYSLSSVAATGAFHPKITLLAGDDSLLLLQGSGNITNGGHGGNHELFQVFYADKDNKTQLSLIQEAWQYLKFTARNIKGMGLDKLNWVEENCSLLSENQIEKHSFHLIENDFSAALLYNEETSIWSQVKALIPQETVTSIQIFSPFYDENGSAIEAMSSYFNKAKIQAFIQPGKGIHPFKAPQNKRIEYFNWETTDRAKNTKTKHEKKLHSKIFWFDAGDSQYAIIGSANATIKAFGTDASRGANDEFSVLIKVKDKSILKELQLTGSYENYKPEQLVKIIEQEETHEKQQEKNIKRIKIQGVDLEEKKLSIFIIPAKQTVKTVAKGFDQWGDVTFEQEISVTKNKIALELNNNIGQISYIQFFLKDGTEISNKQIVNKLIDLWNTNPSVDNRRLMKLAGKIELGENSFFDIIEFYNTIQGEQSNSKSRKSSGSSTSSSNHEKEISGLSYQEAIELESQKKVLNDLENKHNTVKIFDSLDSFYKNLIKKEQDEDMDDEESGNASTSRSRSEKTDRTPPTKIRSQNVLAKNRVKITKFLTNYIDSLRQLKEIENKTFTMIDMAMYLIVMKQLVEVSDRKVLFTSEDKNKDEVVFPTKGRLADLESFSGAILNIVGELVSVLSIIEIQENKEGYTSKKQAYYHDLIVQMSLYGLSVVKQVYSFHNNIDKWTFLLAANLFEKLGIPETINKNSIAEYMKNVSIGKVTDEDGSVTISEETILNDIETWINDYKNLDSESVINCKNLGFCSIEKRIPSEGAPKFYKLGRPGFEFDEDQADFVLSKLYNVNTGELFKSRNSIQSKT